MLEVRQLRCFLAVAETLHFARAADRLDMAQSALSLQVLRLERDLGVRLLNRRKRAAVSLTNAGQAFLPEARSAWQQLERAEQVGRLAARGEVGCVRLGYVASAATSGVLTLALKVFREAHAGVELQVFPMETPRQLDALAQGQLDVGIVRPRPAYPEGVTVQPLQSERLFVALSVDHPLARHSSLAAEDLRSELFIVPHFNEAGGFAEHLRELGRLGGFAAEPSYAVNDFVTALSMASAGYGIVLAPKSLQRFAPADVTLRPVRDLTGEVELLLAHNTREPAAAVQGLIRAALQVPRRLTP